MAKNFNLEFVQRRETVKYYSITEVARMVGVTPQSISHWEERKWVPLSRREGIKRRRLWNPAQTFQILTFSESIGYRPQFWMLGDYEKGEGNETETKESGRQLSLR